METPAQTTPHFAGFWIRFAAVMIDSLIMIVPVAVLNMVLPILGSVLVGVLYKPFFESSALQATPGKALLGLRVTTEEGERISFKQSFIRYLGYIASCAICCIGFLFVVFTGKKQALHDLIAETLVVKQTSPDVKYLDAWVDEVQSVFKTGKTGFDHRTNSVTAQLEELHQLYAKGILTEEEFTRKKEELLKRI